MKNTFNVEITPELLRRAQERLDHILNEGCVHSGISEKFDSSVKPEWYDEERFKEAQKIAKEYYIVISNSSMIGLFLVLQLPIGLIPLLATGQSKSISKLFSRYLNTILHVTSWSEHPAFCPESKAYKSQEMVKSMHKNVCKLMNSKLTVYEFMKKHIEETNKESNNNEEIDIVKLIKRKERVWVSQTDMSLTQWAFIGILILEPIACGGHGLTKEKIVEIAYLWKVYGYRIGIEDEFNLFNELDYDLIYTMCKFILEQEYLPGIENCSNLIGYRMSESTNISLQSASPDIKFRPYMRYWYKTLNINSFKLNQLNKANSDAIRFDFQVKNIKTELTEEDKKLMISNGYNTKYIVPNPQIPFEELKIATFSEKFYYTKWHFSLKVTVRSKFFRNLARRTAKKRCDKSLKNKNKLVDSLKKFYEKNQFSACPFAGQIDNQYLEYTDVNK